MPSWKLTGGIVGAGVVLGLGTIGWMRLHPADAPTLDSKGGSVAIDTRETPAPTADPLALHVASADPASAQGAVQSGSTNNAAGNTAASGAGGASTASGAPGPTDFKQYDQYKDSASALYGDIKPGTGEAVAVGKVVTVAYRGWLTEGTLFDEAITSKPFSFTEGEHRVIPGWEQALLGMKVGGQRRVIVPPAAGYGAEAHGPIPGGSVLVFDVELISVK